MPLPFLPDPKIAHPILLPDGSAYEGAVFLKNVIDHPRFKVGDYTYADSFDCPKDWAFHLAPYLYHSSSEKLLIGKFGQIASGVKFITSSANHATRALTTYPFPIFKRAEVDGYQPDQRDTLIGHDVWLGNGAVILPGARIGHGVIVGAGAVVRGTIPDFSVVVGNPAQVVRTRFSAADIARLLALAWWDWPRDAIAAARPALEAADISALERCAP